MGGGIPVINKRFDVEWDEVDSGTGIVASPYQKAVTLNQNVSQILVQFFANTNFQMNQIYSHITDDAGNVPLVFSNVAIGLAPDAICCNNFLFQALQWDSAYFVPSVWFIYTLQFEVWNYVKDFVFRTVWAVGRNFDFQTFVR